MNLSPLRNYTGSHPEDTGNSRVGRDDKDYISVSDRENEGVRVNVRKKKNLSTQVLHPSPFIPPPISLPINL